MVVRCAVFCAVLFTVHVSAGLRFEQVRNAKSATVLIEVKREFGSGFCVDAAQRLILTNYHVIERVGKARVKLVLSPGEQEQVIVRAEVIRKDKEKDLALLQILDTDGALAALELGDSGKLFETMELTAFGYPFGKSLAVGDGTYPNVSVNVGKVTSLRRDAEHKLCGVQMDALVNPGNSGGPVLDDHGKVVGITVSGIPGSGVNFAIPVEIVRSFLATPELVVAPVEGPRWANRFDPVSLEIKAVCFAPHAGVWECHATVSGQATPQAMAITTATAGKEWTATAPLFVLPPETDPVNVQIETKDVVITTKIAGRALTAGGKKWQLRDVAQIDSNQVLELQDKQIVKPPLDGLAPLTVTMVGQEIHIPLEAMKSLRVLDRQRFVPSVPYRVWLTLDGKEVAAKKGSISMNTIGWGTGASRPKLLGQQPASSGTTAATAPSWGAKAEPVAGSDAADPTETLKLPASFTDCVRAGSGRYLLLPMPKLKQVAVVDLTKREVSGYAPLLEADGFVAGGGRYFYIASPGVGMLDRWTLDPLERNRRVNLPIPHKFHSMTMGAASDGPLLVYHAGGRSLVDGDTMAPLEAVKKRGNRSYNSSYPPNIRAADCGTVFGAWVSGLSPSGLEVLTLLDGQLTSKREHTSVGHVVPGPNGERIYTATRGIFTSGLVPAPNAPHGVRCALPSSHPAYYLGITASDSAHYMRGGKGTRIAIYVQGLATPVLNLPPNNDVAAVNATMSRAKLSFDKRYHLVPQLDLLAIIPSAADRIILRTINVERSLRERGVDFLFVESVPPTYTKAGTTFRYQVVAITSAKTLSYKLETGPPGMAMSATGEITWDVPAAAQAPGGIVVCVKADDGQSAYHAFNLKVVP